MSTVSLRLAQWLPTPVPSVGDSITVAQPEPLETRFGQSAFPEAPTDGTSYGRQNKNWAPIVIPPFLPDAPSNNKFYARRNAAWANLDSFATTDSVIAYVAATSVPEAPVDGLPYMRKDKAWIVSQLDFPVTIDKGGTGATTVAQARLNLGIVNPGGQFVLNDGDVVAPGLSWFNESGLGWYRSGAGQIKLAQGGVGIWALTGSGTDTFSGQYARGLGRSVMSVANAPIGTANFNQLNIEANQTGYSIADQPVGTAGAKALSFGTFPLVTFNQSLVVQSPGGPGIAINNLGPTVEGTLKFQRQGLTKWYFAAPTNDGSGNNFALVRCDAAGTYAATVMLVDFATGNLSLNAPGALSLNAAQLYANGTLSSSGPVYGNNNNAFVANTAANWGGGSPVYGINALQSNPNWNPLYLQTIHQPGQWAGWRMTSQIDNAYIDFSLSGQTPQIDMHGGRIIGASFGGKADTAGRADSAAAADNATRANGVYFNWVGQGVLGYVWMSNDPAGAYPVNSGEFCTRVTNNVIRFGWTGASLIARVDGTDMTVNTTPSDERIKADIVPMELRRDQFMALAPIEYSFADVRLWKDDGIRHWGWSAQNVQAALGIAAAYGGEDELPADDADPWTPMQVDDRPILALTVLQVQDLINRVQQLEAA